MLRQTVTVLIDRIGNYTWVGLYFVEDGGLVLGPSKGVKSDGPRLDAPVLYNRMHVATLEVVTNAAPGGHDQPFLERIAVLISAHCLVGWDTGGVPWQEGQREPRTTGRPGR